MKRKKRFRCLCVISLLLCAFLLMGVSCSVSTANVNNAVLTTGVDQNNEPIDRVSSFPVNSIACVAAQLHNAPDGTLITFKWYANGVQVDEYSIDNNGQSEAAIACGSDKTSEPGDYKVEIYINEREQPDAALEFTVK